MLYLHGRRKGFSIRIMEKFEWFVLLMFYTFADLYIPLSDNHINI